MKTFVGLCVLLAIGAARCGLIPAATAALVRTPSLDSAVVRSERLGPNFAYSTVESHAYAAPSPIAITYAAQQVPVGYAISQPFLSHQAFLTQPFLTQQLISSPIFANPIFPQAPIITQNPALAPVAPQQPEQQNPAAAQDPAPAAPVQNPVQAPSPIQIPQIPGFGGFPGLPAQNPVQAPSPIQIPQFPSFGGIPSAPAPPQAAPTPVEGNIVDDDTVAVDSA